MKQIIKGRQTNCTNPPESVRLFIDQTIKLKTLVNPNPLNNFPNSLTQFRSSSNNHLQCKYASESSFSGSASNSFSDSGSGSYSNQTRTFSQSYTNRGGKTRNSSRSVRQEFDKYTLCRTSNGSYFYTGSQSGDDYVSENNSGSTFNSTSSNATRNSSTSSSSSQSSTSDRSSYSTSNSINNTYTEEGCSSVGYAIAVALSESTSATLSDRVYYDEIKQFITKTTSVCSTDITNTNPVLSFEERTRTTEAYSKFIASTTIGNFPIETETKVDYYQTETVSTDWTQTASTEWTSTETSATGIFTTTEEATTTNSRNNLGELIEYGTTQRKNTTTDATTTVLGTTSKETTETGGTTETTTATLSKTDGTETTLSEGEISTWAEGTSSRFKTGTSQRDIETSDLAFCDYGGWVETCITHSQEDYIASIVIPPVSGDSPYYTNKGSTLLDTGQTVGSTNYYFTTEYHFNNPEALVEWIEPPLHADGTKWLSWNDVFTSSSIGELESTSYSVKPLKKKNIEVVLPDFREIVTDTDYRFTWIEETEQTLNSVPEYDSVEAKLKLECNVTEYNSVPQMEECSFFFTLATRGGDYLEQAFADNLVTTTYTDLVKSTSASKVLLPVKFSTEHLGETHSHLFGWDLVDQVWTYDEIVTYSARMNSTTKVFTEGYGSGFVTGNDWGTSTYQVEHNVVVTSYYSDEDRNIISFEPQIPFADDEANDLLFVAESSFKIPEMTAVYEPDLAIGYIGFGEVLQEELALASAYGFMKKESAGETFHSDDELNIDLTNISSAALLAADSASIFYTNDCFAPAFGEQTGTTSWGNTRKCTDEDDAVLFNTSTEIHATYSKEYETDDTTSTSYAYATYSLSLDMPFENYGNPLLLKASISDSVVGNRTPNYYRANHMVQLKNLTNNISYTMKRGEYEVKAFDNSNNIIADETQTTTEDIIRVVNDGNTNIRKITSNELLLYQRRKQINSQGPLYPTYFTRTNNDFFRFNPINGDPNEKYFTHYSFTRSDLRSTSSNSGREDGWLGPTVVLCDSSG